MITYVVKQGNQLLIYQIEDAQKTAFLAEFSGKIIVEGTSVHDILLKINHFPVIFESPH